MKSYLNSVISILNKSQTIITSTSNYIKSKDHLGDVVATYTDLKLANFLIGQDPQQPFSLDLRSVSSYYPFGMLQPYRHWEATSYFHRFGYNGKEKDDDIKGLGNSYDYGARFYDPRLGRFLSLDPLKAEFGNLSPFSYAFNSPIQAIDKKGEYGWIVNLDYKNSFWDNFYLARVTPYVYKHLWEIPSNSGTPSKDYHQNIFGTYISMTENERLKLEQKVNSYITKWADENIAPKISEYLKNTTIPIAIVNGLHTSDFPDVNGVKDSESLNLYMNETIYKTDLMEKTLLHEIIHNMKFGEFQAYAGVYASFGNARLFQTNYFKINEKVWNYYTNGMPDELKNMYIKNMQNGEACYELPNEKRFEFLTKAKEIGDEVVGRVIEIVSPK